jgi:quinol monooxygenase YgiN
MIGMFIALLMATAALVPPAHAQANAVFLATYVEVMPNAVAPGIALLKQYRDASSKEDGNLRIKALAEIERPNRFVVVEAWRDKAALEAHGQSAATLKFRDKLKPIADAPYDERINNALYVAQGNYDSQSGAIYVLTHVDVIPAGKDDCMAALKAMSIDTASDAGNISYEVLQQQPRQPLHRHRSMDRSQGTRRPCHGGAYAGLSRKDQPGRGRALRRAHLQGAGLTLALLLRREILIAVGQ